MFIVFTAIIIGLITKPSSEIHDLIIMLIIFMGVVWLLDIIASFILLITEIKAVYCNEYNRRLFGLIRSNLPSPTKIYNKTKLNKPTCVCVTIINCFIFDLPYIILLLVDSIYFITHAGRIEF